MKKKLLLTAMSATLSLGVLGACGVDNNRMNDDNGVDYSPVRYDRQDNNGVFDNDRRNGVEPVRYDTDNNNRGIFNGGDNNRGNNNGMFDTNTDLIDNDRGSNGIDPGTNGRNNDRNGINGTHGNGTMRSGS